MGASAARSLAERGHETVLFESRGPANPLGSSHGRSRIVRRAYPDPAFTEMMDEAYPLWRELERASGRALLREVGLLYFGREDNRDIVDLREGLARLGVEHRLVGPDEARRFVEGIRFEPSDVGVFTPEAGWVDAEASVRATVDLAVRLGTAYREELAPSLDRLREDFDQVVIAAGSWVRDWIDLPVQRSLQAFAYLSGSVGGSVWIEASDDNLYGFPSEPGSGSFKVGIHRRGPEPDGDLRAPLEEHLSAIRELGARRFGLAAEVVEACGCVYTNTADEGFLIGRHDESVVYASACSGHGFKFGPWVGRRLAELCEGC